MDFSDSSTFILVSKLESAIQQEPIFLNADKYAYISLFEELTVRHYIKITQPKKIHYSSVRKNRSFPHAYYHIHTGLHGGLSIKPGNITLNWKKLVYGIPSIIESSIAIETNNIILIGCSALTLCKTINKILSVEISKEQSIVLLALWQGRKYRRKIPVSDGLNLVNKFCKIYSEEPMDNKVYQRTLDELLRLKCIDLVDDKILLIEKVSRKYH